MQNALQKAFGLSVEVTEMAAPSGLPLYMTAGASFYHVQISGIPFLLIELPAQDRFGAVALEKQLVKYAKSSGMNAAYSIHGLTRVQRDALIGRMIPFVSLPEQIFLPFLGIALNNRFLQQKIINIERFTPASQCLFLHFLYRGELRSELKKDAADALGLTRTSITRASGQLTAMGLLTEEPVGREIRMTPVACGRDFYELGKPFLISPVARIITVEMDELLGNFPLAGESALAEQSMLTPPPFPVRAIRKDTPGLPELKNVDEKWETGHSLLRLELWKYDPLTFARDGAVDPVSLAVSLESVFDERVQGELDDYMEGLQW